MCFNGSLCMYFLSATNWASSMNHSRIRQPKPPEELGNVRYHSDSFIGGLYYRDYQIFRQSKRCTHTIELRQSGNFTGTAQSSDGKVPERLEVGRTNSQVCVGAADKLFEVNGRRVNRGPFQTVSCGRCGRKSARELSLCSPRHGYVSYLSKRLAVEGLGKPCGWCSKRWLGKARIRLRTAESYHDHDLGTT